MISDNLKKEINARLSIEIKKLDDYFGYKKFANMLASIESQGEIEILEIILFDAFSNKQILTDSFCYDDSKNSNDTIEEVVYRFYKMLKIPYKQKLEKNKQKEQKMWKKIEVNIQNIAHQTEKAVLIKMPKKSRYADYVFWHTKKLVRNGIHDYVINLSYTDEFLFTLRKYGKGITNYKEVLDEKVLNGYEIEEIFANRC